MERGEAFREANSHHLFWVRAWYKSPIERCLRSHQGLIIPMYVDVHRELHANVAPPPKPSSQVILGSLAMLDELPQRILSDPLQTVQYLHDWLDRSQMPQTDRIATNIAKQLPYLQEGYHG